MWAPLAGTYLFAISALATGLAWAPGAPDPTSPRQHRNGDVRSPGLATLGSNAFTVLATVLAWVLPAGLVVLTWLSSHSTPVQQRYYIATA